VVENAVTESVFPVPWLSRDIVSQRTVRLQNDILFIQILFQLWLLQKGVRFDLVYGWGNFGTIQVSRSVINRVKEKTKGGRTHKERISSIRSFVKLLTPMLLAFPFLTRPSMALQVS
jgi:hypothetical protein